MAHCPKCASHVVDDALFCGQCGERINQVDSATPEAESPAANAQEAPGADLALPAPPAEAARVPFFARVPKVAWIAIACMVIAAVGFASFQTFFMTPKMRFLQAQAHYLATKLNDTPDYLKLQADLQKRMASEVSHSEYTISAVLHADNDPNLDEINRILRTSKLVLGSQQDPKAEISKGRVELHVRGSELAAVDLWQSPDRFALHIPVIYRDYIVLENRDFRRMAERLGIYGYDGPDKYETGNPIVGSIQEREPELKKLLSRYGREIIALIPDEAFTLEKRATYESPDGPVKADRLALELSEQELRDFMTAVVDQMRNDDEGLEFAADLFAAIFKAQFENAAITGQEPRELRELTDPSTLRRKMREGLSDFRRELDQFAFPEGLTWVLWLEGKQIVRQDLSLTVARDQGLRGVTYGLTTADWQNKSEKSSAFRIVAEPFGPLGRQGAAFETYSRTTNPSKQETKTVSSYELKVSERSLTNVGLRLDLETLVEQQAEPGKDRVTYTFTAGFDGSGLGDMPNLDGTIVSLASNTIVKDHYEQNIAIDVGMNMYGERMGLMLNVHRTADLKQPSLTFPDLDSGAVILNNMSDREMQEFLLNLSLSLNQFVARNANLFQ